MARKKKPRGCYIIYNTISEFNSAPSAFFETLEEAKEAIRHFGDWWSSRGTGSIYFQQFGTHSHMMKSWNYGVLPDVPEYYEHTSGYSREFVCRGLGIDEKTGEVTFSDKPY